MLQSGLGSGFFLLFTFKNLKKNQRNQRNQRENYSFQSFLKKWRSSGAHHIVVAIFLQTYCSSGAKISKFLPLPSPLPSPQPLPLPQPKISPSDISNSVSEPIEYGVSCFFVQEFQFL